MRPGPPTDLLADSVVVGCDLSVVRGREVLAPGGVPAWNVELDETDDRVVPGQLTFMAPRSWVPTHPLAPLANFGQRVHVTQTLTAGTRPWKVGIGWFKIDSWEEQDEGVQVTALDLLSIPDEDPLVWPSSPPAGATLLSELRRMAAPLPVVLDDPSNPAVPRNTQYATSRTENIRDLCSSYGKDYAVQDDGYLHVWARRDGRDPVATYSGVKDLGTPGARPGRLLSSPRKSLPRRANRFTVVGTQGSGEDEQRWSATVSATQPPYDPEAYGVKHERHEMNMATSQNQVSAAANTYMRNAMIATEVRSLEMPSDSRLQRGDVISVHTKAGEFFTGRARQIYLPVSDHKKNMRVDAEVLLW